MHKNVFIVDDEPLIAQSIESLLSDEGYDVSTFHNGADVLKTLSEDNQPHCFVVDYILPDMDGMSLIKKLRDQGYWQPFLVVSGRGDVPTVVDFMRLGAVTFIEKPFHADHLISSIKTAFERYEEDAENQTVLSSMRQLSPREMDVLREMNDGKDSETIGTSLGISQKTVEVHKTRIFKKLGYQSTAQVVANTNFFFKSSEAN